MSINELEAKVRSWAIIRELDKAEPSKQMLKLMEETGELAADLAKNRCPKDSIGDCLVVLCILCLQLGFSIEEPLKEAYEEIANRKGVMKNGVFIKESDL